MVVPYLNGTKYKFTYSKLFATFLSKEVLERKTGATLEGTDTCRLATTLKKEMPLCSFTGIKFSKTH
jgi:hypothetical protein